MPLYQNIRVTADITVYLWKVTESEAALSKDITLNANSSRRVERMKSAVHRRGYLSIRHLLALAGYSDADLYYDEIGKPHLSDGRYISITHSGHFTGIIVSDKVAVGIDIERQREKIASIAHKFTTPKDYDSISDPDLLIRKLTVVWGAKESIYKIYASRGLSFLQHIDIADFHIDAGESSGLTHFEGVRSSYHIRFLEFEGYTCVYALTD